MEFSALAFWVIFALILFSLFIFFIAFFLSSVHKRRLEKKLDDIHLEVRELNLRVTVVETRVDERTTLMAQLPMLPKKRGRPRKTEELEE